MFRIVESVAKVTEKVSGKLEAFQFDSPIRVLELLCSKISTDKEESDDQNLNLSMSTINVDEIGLPDSKSFQRCPLDFDKLTSESKLQVDSAVAHPQNIDLNSLRILDSGKNESSCMDSPKIDAEQVQDYAACNMSVDLQDLDVWINKHIPDVLPSLNALESEQLNLDFGRNTTLASCESSNNQHCNSSYTMNENIYPTPNNEQGDLLSQLCTPIIPSLEDSDRNRVLEANIKLKTKSDSFNGFTGQMKTFQTKLKAVLKGESTALEIKVIPTIEIDKSKCGIMGVPLRPWNGRRKGRCKMCPGCYKPNCGVCRNCLDMVKYGGAGKYKRACLMRECHNKS